MTDIFARQFRDVTEPVAAHDAVHGRDLFPDRAARGPRRLGAGASISTPAAHLFATSAALAALVGCGADAVVAGPGGGGDAIVDAGADTAIVEIDGGQHDVGVDDGAPGDATPADAVYDAGGTPCQTDVDCLDLAESACAKPRCIAGSCGLARQPVGSPCDIPGLDPGPCQAALCDGLGKCQFAPVPDGTSCGNGGADDGCAAACKAGTCQAGGAADDGNPCTSDLCDNGEVVHLPISDPNVKCEDGNPCTSKDACVAGVCQGVATACDDGVSCTIDYCAPGKGCAVIVAAGLCDDGNPCTTEGCDANNGCVHAGVLGASCDDGDACTQGEVCVEGGVCGGGKGVCQCKTVADCGKGNACVAYACEQGLCKALPVQDPCGGQPGTECQGWTCDPATGGCVAAPLKEGKPCDDSNVCTSESVCSGGACVAKGQINCNDGNPCTQDACDAVKGCTTVAAPMDGKACNDGNACTQPDLCKAGGCNGSAKACSDGNPCTKDACDPKAGTCVFTAIPGCGQGCTSDASCNDNNACTSDTCEPGADGWGGCVHSPIPGCGGGCTSDAACDDGKPCTKDACVVGSTGSTAKTCIHVPIPGCLEPMCKSKADCPQPGGVCLEAICSDAGQCIMQPIPGCIFGCKSDDTCEDGDKCTINKCQIQGVIGTCVASPNPQCAPQCSKAADCPWSGTPCTVAVCVDGICGTAPDPSCSSGCTSDAGCDDKDPCTKDACVKSPNGVATCQHSKIPNCGGGCQDTAGCNDNNACTGDSCVQGKCAFVPKVCNDGEACTYDACDVILGGCVFSKIEGCGGGCKSNADCADNNNCVSSYCSGGKCQGVPKVCNDNNACTYDQCNPVTGACVFAPIPGCKNQCKTKEDCNDGNPCSYDNCLSNGTCSNVVLSGCNPNAPKCTAGSSCDDGKPCTTDTCNSAVGLCFYYDVPNCIYDKPCKVAKDCDDKNACTTDVCANGKCAPKPISCDDFNPCTNDYCQSNNGSCIHTSKPGCVAESCKLDSECDDGNKCTKDLCLFGFCQHIMDPACK